MVYIEIWKYSFLLAIDVLLAVDGGATKTEAIVYDGEIKGAGVSGPGNYHNVGLKAAGENTAHAITEAFQMAGCEWKDIDRAFYGFAGVESSRTSRSNVENMLEGVHRHGTMKLYNDGVAAYYLATLGENGVVAAAGTGSVVQAGDGKKHVRVGGWGWFLGDEGSAYYIGRRGLQAATQSFDGRSGHTTLISALERELNSEFPEAIAHFQENPSVNNVAAFAPVVTEEAAKGDDTSRKICAEAGSDLALAVRAAVERLELKGGYVIGAVGGVFRGGSVITDVFKENLSGCAGTLAPIYYGYHVVVGAVLMERHEKGDAVSAELAQKLVSQLEGKMRGIPLEERHRFLFLK